LIDHDILETVNLARHILPLQYVGRNKAQGLAEHLAEQVDGLKTEAISRKIDQSVSDDLLDEWLDVDLIVAATDDRRAQRRVGERALVPSTPAIFPALYVEDGGEVVVQLDRRLPCFGCWDYFRTNEEQLRGVTGLNIAGWPVIHTSIRLCLGILDPDSEDGSMMAPEEGQRQPIQNFLLNRSGELKRAILTRRPTCPSCAVGPSPLRREAAHAWRAAERSRPRTAPLAARQQRTNPIVASGPLAPQRDIDSGVTGLLGTLVMAVSGGIGALLGGVVASLAMLLALIAALWIAIELLSLVATRSFM
jgi:hypothetical protein